MPTGDPAPELDSEALAAVIALFLGQFSDDQMEVAGEAGIKLNRLLLGFRGPAPGDASSRVWR